MIDNIVIREKKQFQFDKRWIGEKGFMESVSRGLFSRDTMHIAVTVKYIYADTKFWFEGKINHFMGMKK